MPSTSTSARLGWHRLVHVLLLLLLIFASESRAKVNDTCLHEKKLFGVAQSHLMQCAVSNAEPVTFCQQCIGQFVDMEATWANLTRRGADNGNNGTACLERYVNKDRLNLLLVVRSKALELWDGAACENCFVRAANGSLTTKPTEATEHFVLLLNEHLECVRNSQANSTSSNGTSTVCADCEGFYKNLNDYYLKHVQRSVAETDGVCFDLRDNINRTRRAWSDEFKCCRDRHESRFAFALCASVMALLPVLFYGGAVVLRLRHERRDPMLLDADAEPWTAAASVLAQATQPQPAATSAVDDPPPAATAAAAAATATLLNFDDDDISLLGAAAPIAANAPAAANGVVKKTPTNRSVAEEKRLDDDDDDEALDSDVDALDGEPNDDDADDAEADEIQKLKADAHARGFR